MKQPPKYSNHKTRYDIPDNIAIGVGKLIVRWAHLEYALQTVIWNLTQVTAPLGRLAVREPRVEDRANLIRDLASLRGIEVDAKLIDAVASEAKKMRSNRDLLAHGYWIFDPDRNAWCVVMTRGRWSDNEPHPRLKSIVPEALIVTPVAMEALISTTDNLIRLSLLVAQQVESQLQPPPEVPPSRLPRKSQNRGRSS